MSKFVKHFCYSEKNTEYLTFGSETWEQIAEKIPGYGLLMGCGAQISRNEFLVIGGFNTEDRVLRFTTNDNVWHNTSLHLFEKRYNLQCISFNKKVIITGGFLNNKHLSTTEIIDFSEDELLIRKGGDLKEERSSHGMGIITISGVPTLIAFGGSDPYHIFRDSVEIWNDASESWEISNSLRLEYRKYNFGFAMVPTDLLCP